MCAHYTKSKCRRPSKPQRSPVPSSQNRQWQKSQFCVYQCRLVSTKDIHHRNSDLFHWGHRKVKQSQEERDQENEEVPLQLMLWELSDVFACSWWWHSGEIYRQPHNGHRPPCEDDDLNPPKEVCGEKLCHADFIGGGLFLHQKVSHEFGCHSGVVEEIWECKAVKEEVHGLGD